MREIIFEVPGKPQGKGRPRFSPDGHAYTPAATRLYEREILKAYRAAGGTKMSGPLHVDIEAIYGIQKTATKAERLRRLNGDELALKKPDTDNIEKIVYDALNGAAYDDDACIVSTRTIKGRYEDKPRLIVRIREIETREVDSRHRWMWGDGNGL
jgi:Holliday junction resolvase RusA-like endonuclease